MGSRSLKSRKLNGTGLKPCLGRNLISQESSRSGHLLMSEGIYHNVVIGKLAYITSVGKLDPFRYRYYDR